MEILTTAETSKKWDISTRRITTLCNEGRIDGTVLKGNTWLISDNVEKPICQKKRQKKNEDCNGTNEI